MLRRLATRLIPRTGSVGWMTIGVLLIGGGSGERPAPAIGTPGPVIQLSPRPVGLRDGQVVRVSGSGFSPRAAVIVVQCSPRAVTDGPDFCNERFVAVAPASGQGSFTARFRVHPVIQTAAGTVNCQTEGCLMGAENLGMRSQLAASSLQFAEGPASGSSSTAHPQAPRLPELKAVAIARPGVPAHLSVLATLAGDVARGRIGAVVSTPSRGSPSARVRGEGLLSLTMSGPQSSWASRRNTSVVVESSVDRRPPQIVVLFAGVKPFTYQGFTGPLSTGRHEVTVRVRRDLSRALDVLPTAVVQRVQLAVVGPQNPGYRALAYAPVLYDRRVVAASDTPMLTYATVDPRPHGASRISYVVTWSNEDGGTGFAPFLLWGGYGRMSDIEDAISLTVDRAGRVHDPVYLACTTCPRDFPEDRTALDETFTSFHGRYFGHHPILRVSTGNNDFSDQGRTGFRVQQGLVAAPVPGQTREGAMDRNPWSYGITDQEVVREREDFSTDPLATGPGYARQYLIITLDTEVRNVDAVGVDLQLAGDDGAYRNDFDTTYPLYTGGHGRTVVKVPLSEVDRRITMLRLRLQTSAANPTIRVRRLHVLQYSRGVIVERRVPAFSVVIQPSTAADASAVDRAVAR